MISQRLADKLDDIAYNFNYLAQDYDMDEDASLKLLELANSCWELAQEFRGDKP